MTELKIFTKDELDEMTLNEKHRELGVNIGTRWNDEDWKIQRENRYLLRKSIQNFVENRITYRTYTFKKRQPPYYKNTLRSKLIMLRFKEGYGHYINYIQHGCNLCYMLVSDYSEFAYYDFAENKWVIWEQDYHLYMPREMNIMVKGWSYISKEMQEEFETKWNTLDNVGYILKPDGYEFTSYDVEEELEGNHRYITEEILE